MRRILFLSLLFIVPLTSLHAATITVDDGAADSVSADGNCSLREAIQSANSDSAPNADCTDGSGADEIDLSGVSTEIDLGSALDDLSTDITITGPGADTLTVDAQSGDFSIFNLTVSADVTITGLTITGATPSSGNGGAVRVTTQAASLTVNNCHLTGNGVGASQTGGALSSLGTTTILNSTFSNNQAGNGGAVSNRSNGQMTIKNSTFSGNSANVNGGGINQLAAGGSPTLSIINSTITNNTADSDDNGSGTAGGLYNNVDGVVTLTNTIVADNIDEGGQGPDCGGTIGSNGFNIMGDDSTCFFSPTTGDQVGDSSDPIDPRLTALQDNGGPTTTHGLLPDSPALDAGTDTPVCSGADTEINDEDQRGLVRCVDADGDGGTIDIGAFELQVHIVDDTGIAGDSSFGDGVCNTGAGVCTLNAAINEVNNFPGPEAIRFSVTGTISPSVAPSVAEDLAIFGPGADTLAIDGGSLIAATAVLIFNSSGGGATLRVTDLTLSGASNSLDGGGIQSIDTTDNLILESMIIDNNEARSGGGVYFVGPSLEISDTTFSGNSATLTTGGGGLRIARTGDLSATIRRSTFEGNSSAGGGGAMRLDFDGNGSISLTNVTLSGNQADGHGGGIDLIDGTLNVSFSTITRNTADDDNNGAGNAGGIYSGVIGTVVNVANTIISDNADRGGEEPDCGGNVAFTSGGYNIVGDDTGCDGEFNATGDQADTNPLLNSTLADNGGETETHALQENSPAIDAGDPACNDAAGDSLTVDQRSFPRPVDGDDDSTATCDVGAFETGSCGDGTLDPGEECDNGAGNSDSEANACRTDCTNFSCGDGTVDSSESCDDGNNDDDDDCRNDCSVASCGDGIVDSGESCDDGANNSDSQADACRTTCVSASCGDGVQDDGEDCDDGNANNDDGCTTACVANAAGDLNDVNPDVDFNNLEVGETVTLNAPDPTGGTSSILLAQTAPDNCNCTWSVDPESRGSFSDTTTCQTDFTPEASGTGTLLVDVDCGVAGFGQFFQQFTVNEFARGATSGGCSLIRR